MLSKEVYFPSWSITESFCFWGWSQDLCSALMAARSHRPLGKMIQFSFYEFYVRSWKYIQYTYMNLLLSCPSSVVMLSAGKAHWPPFPHCYFLLPLSIYASFCYLLSLLFTFWVFSVFSLVIEDIPGSPVFLCFSVTFLYKVLASNCVVLAALLLTRTLFFLLSYRKYSCIKLCLILWCRHNLTIVPINSAFRCPLDHKRL